MAKAKAGDARKVAPLSALREKYGRINTEYISTGNPVLDELWNGGMPTGKIIEIHSQAGLGKCLVGSTRVHTTEGYITINELQEKATGDLVDSTKSLDVGVLNGYRTNGFYYGGVKPTRKFKSEEFEIETSFNHRIKGITPSGVDWIKASNIKVGDWICLMKKQDILFNNPTPKPSIWKDVSEKDYGWLLGLLLGDGGVQRTRVYYCGNEEILNKVKSISSNVNWKEYQGKGSDNLHLNSLKVATEFNELGLGGNSYTKKVPAWVFRSNEEFITGFLSGIMDSDGCATNPELCFMSEELLLGCRALFNLMGTYPKLTKKTLHYRKEDGFPPRTAHRLIFRKSTLVSLSYLDLQGSIKREQLRSIIEDSKLNSINKCDYIPFCDKYFDEIKSAYDKTKENRDWSKKPCLGLANDFPKRGKSNYFRWLELRELSGSASGVIDSDYSKYYFVQVKSIEEGQAEVFDISVPESHAYYANGLESHNSTICLQISKHMLKKGKKVGYLDVESALDDSLKEKIGVVEYEQLGVDGKEVSDKNPPAFLHLRPITFTEVEQTMNYLIENEYDLIIYDSLTMTVADRIMEGSFISDQPGLKSRYQAQFLEQYKGTLARMGTTMIIINQMRNKISFISTTLEPAGGEALKFNTDIRTGLRRVEWLVEDGQKDKKVGVKIEAVTIKNKLALPFKTACFYLYFGKGIDLLQTISEILIDRGLIVQGGSYFKLPDGSSVQGKKGVFDWVKSHKSEAKQLLGEYTTFYSKEAVENEASDE